MGVVVIELSRSRSRRVSIENCRLNNRSVLEADLNLLCIFSSDSAFVFQNSLLFLYFEHGIRICSSDNKWLLHKWQRPIYYSTTLGHFHVLV